MVVHSLLIIRHNLHSFTYVWESEEKDFFGKSLSALCENGHFKNVQKSKPAPDLYQKSGFSDLEHNAANCENLCFLL